MKTLAFIDKYWWGVVALVAGGVYALIMLLSLHQAVWFDESYSILLAKSSFAELWALTAVDAHPPLYYVLLKVWGSLFGFSDFALRSFSAVSMAAAISLAVSLVRKVFSTKIALMTLPFLVLAPFLLRYGYEIRMYAPATLIAVGATYALVMAKRTDKKHWWIIYGVLVALGMYTLYLTVAVWLAQALWLLIGSLKSKERPFWKWRWLYVYAGAVLLFAAYIPTFIHQLLYSALPGIGSAITITKLGDVYSMLALFTPEWALGGWWAIVLIAFFALLVVLIARVRKGLRGEPKATYDLILLLALVPIAFFALTSLPPRDPIFIIRYMAHVSLFIYLLAGLALALGWVQKAKKQDARGHLLLVASATALGLIVLASGVTMLSKTGNFNFERLQKPMTQDVRNAAACDQRTTVVADDQYTYIDSAFYFEDCDMRFYAADEQPFKGGYAPLHASQSRITSSQQIDTPRLVHLRWNGGEPSFTVDSRYALKDSYIFDKQVVDVYERV